VGGDYYDFIPLSATRLGFTVADVSGKGVPGSMGMTMARSVLRAQAAPDRLPGATMARVNRIIQPDIRKGMFVTMFYCILDTTNHQISCGNAGHNPAFKLSSGGEIEAIGPEGMALGLAPSDYYFVSEYAFTMKPGDYFALYTDGVTEAMNAKQDEYGEDRFVESFKRRASQDFGTLTRHVVEDIQKFTQGAPQNDDITLLFVHRIS
jgi:sigma-B regulation protein RsbU (phosphoserine phosphatase)